MIDGEPAVFIQKSDEFDEYVENFRYKEMKRKGFSQENKRKHSRVSCEKASLRSPKKCGQMDLRWAGKEQKTH